MDELLADEQSRRYAKRKYAEIMTAKQSGGKKFRAKQKVGCFMNGRVWWLMEHALFGAGGRGGSQPLSSPPHH